MSEVVSYDDIMGEIVAERIKAETKAKGGQPPPRKFAEAHGKALAESWRALNAWISANMAKRRGVHLPQLCRMTWEFMTDPESGNVRVRPVFVLTEAFIRGLRLPNSRKPELPETIAPCQDINYSKIAIKFSESLTKVSESLPAFPVNHSPHVSLPRKKTIEWGALDSLIGFPIIWRALFTDPPLPQLFLPVCLSPCQPYLPYLLHTHLK